MRIRSAVITLATYVVLAWTAVVALPAPATADWTEQSRPCDVVAGAILPQPSFQSKLGAPTHQPEGFFTAVGSFPPPPESDFTATAKWGDGTTTPATIEEAQPDGFEPGGCYEVSVPSHLYMTPGTYSFSYTVHDATTGLDHALASARLQVLGDITRLVEEPPSTTIHAVAGRPWNGVVAEFTYEGLEPPQDLYTAAIEWGDGTAASPGTITPSGEGFAVTGSHTYGHAIRGALAVVISRTPGLSDRWPAGGAIATEPAAFRLLGRPLLAATSRRGNQPGYTIIFRLDRPLPATKAGRPYASVKAFGHSSPVRALRAGGAGRCYLAPATFVGSHNQKAGSLYPFVVTINAGETLRYRGQMALRRFSNASRMRRAAGAELGCR